MLNAHFVQMNENTSLFGIATITVFCGMGAALEPDMNFVNRISSGFVARIDRVVSQIENHEAHVEATLRELRRGTARAKVNLSRVRRDGERLRVQYAEARESEQTWKRRALSSRDSDPERALECLRRARRAQSDANDLDSRLGAHQDLERKLSEEVRQLEHRVASLQERHHAMQTRASCAEGASLVGNLQSGAASEIEAAFDRWEVQLAEGESLEIGACGVDDFANAFESEEELAELQAELAKLEL